MDGIMMSRHYDSGKPQQQQAGGSSNDYSNSNNSYRPIPVYSGPPHQQRHQYHQHHQHHRGVKPYHTPHTQADAHHQAPPRYDGNTADASGYSNANEYKTTHYPSYPPNYPSYEEVKYRADASAQGHHGYYDANAPKAPQAYPGYEAAPIQAQQPVPQVPPAAPYHHPGAPVAAAVAPVPPQAYPVAADPQQVAAVPVAQPAYDARYAQGTGYEDRAPPNYHHHHQQQQHHPHQQQYAYSAGQQQQQQQQQPYDDGHGRYDNREYDRYDGQEQKDTYYDRYYKQQRNTRDYHADGARY